MFDTKSTKYNVVEVTPRHTDSLALVSDACRQQGSVLYLLLRYGLASSISGTREAWIPGANL